MSFLSFQNVSYAYHNLKGETQAVKKLSFDIEEGEFVAIVGPSGCGKSTILSLISGIFEPEEGEIKYGKKKRPMIGYMLQKDHLFPWRTIWANCMLGLEIQQDKTPEKIAYAEYLMREYKLWEVRDKKPNELSGGMRQRAALVRTLVLKPELFLLDEQKFADTLCTIAGMDEESRLRIRRNSVARRLEYAPEIISEKWRLLFDELYIGKNNGKHESV